MKGVIYYSDCRGDPRVLDAVRRQLARATSLPIVSCTLAPVDLGTNIVLPLARGYETMFRQILTALEASEADHVFFCEHDCLYHPSHFDFTPPLNDTFYYNQHTWRLCAKTGRALFYFCNQVSGICVNRLLAIRHYRARVAHVEAHGFDRKLGFEPWANTRARDLEPNAPATWSSTWMSAAPNVDIKTDFCLTPGRWDQAQFRNKRTCEGWTENDRIPFWGVTKDRVSDFLADVEHGRAPKEQAA